MKSVNVPISSVMDSLTIEVGVTGFTGLKIRVWIAVRLIKLAALILGGCKTSIDIS